MASITQPQEQFNTRTLLILCAIMGLIWAGAAAIWSSGSVDAALLLAYIGIFIGGGLGTYLALPRRKRPMGRRIMVLMMGSLLLALALTTDHGNMQIEGLFFGIMAGSAPYILLHFALAKLVGPLAVGRVWCGWACWFGMIFDLLPYPYSRYRIPGRWTWLRYVHFALSLAIAAGLWISLGYSGATGQAGMIWFTTGLALYYVVGIGMAYALKDNRAFCKYLCPLAVLLKMGARASLLRITGDASQCGDCQACTELCPMNIRVRDYIQAGERVRSTECTLCQHCINVCPQNALKLSFGVDVGGRELIDFEPPRRSKKQ